MKKIAAIFLLCLLLTACGKPEITLPEGYYSGDPAAEQSEEAQPTFCVEKEEHAMGDEYFLCRQDVDGTVTRLFSLGLEATPFLVEDGRIYFTDGDTLVSTGLEGQDRRTFFDDQTEEQYSFNRVLKIEDGWISCSGTKWAEITDDPAALPGPHRVKAITRVKTDFSEFYEVEARD